MGTINGNDFIERLDRLENKIANDKDAFNSPLRSWHTIAGLFLITASPVVGIKSVKYKKE